LLFGAALDEDDDVGGVGDADAADAVLADVDPDDRVLTMP
jgi:hypothetical protein